MKKSLLLLLVLFGSYRPAFAGGPGIPRVAIERIKQATVFIVSRYVALAALEKEKLDESDIRFVGNGSGFLMSKTGLVITNAHVVAPSKTLPDGQEDELTRVEWTERKTYVLYDVEVWCNSGQANVKKYPAKVLCTRPFPKDLALLRIFPDGDLPEPPPMDPTRRLDPGRDAELTQEVWAVGFPLGMNMENNLAQGANFSKNPNGPDISIRKGNISSLRKGERNRLKVIEHSCPIEHGNSGGPLINNAGNIMGINSFRIGERSFFAIPLDVILDSFMDTLNLERYSTLFQAQNIQRKTLIINPDAASDGKTTFKTIEAALAKGKWGDTFKLAAGTYTLSHELQIPAGCKFMGAGVGRTIIKPAGNFSPVVTVGAAAAFEMSDLSIEAKQDGTALVVLTAAEGNTFLHDLELTSEVGVALVLGGSADINNCRLTSSNITIETVNGTRYFGKALIISRNGGVRITCCNMESVAEVIGTSAAFDGCRGDGFFFHGEDTNVSAQGCHLRSYLLNDKAKGSLANSIMKEREFLEVRKGSTGTFTGNHFTQYPGLIVNGQGTTAKVTGNYFLNNGVALSASEGAKVLFEKNTVEYHEGYPPRAILKGAKNETTFGIAAWGGSGTAVTSKGNQFTSYNDGYVMSHFKDATINSQGDNSTYK